MERERTVIHDLYLRFYFILISCEYFIVGYERKQNNFWGKLVMNHQNNKK